MTVLRMCDLGHVSRAGLYRYDPKAETADDDLDLRDDIQNIALEFPYYGRPRITAELELRGCEVNHKRVGRMMREDNLLCLRKRKFIVPIRAQERSVGFWQSRRLLIARVARRARCARSATLKSLLSSEPFDRLRAIFLGGKEKSHYEETLSNRIVTSCEAGRNGRMAAQRRW